MVSDHNSWPEAPEQPDCGADDVHVWRAYLNQDGMTAQSLADLLSPDEHQRAEQYHFQRDREHFIVARGILRTILSRYLNVPPGQLRFACNQYGKPALMREAGDDGLRFNLSHANGLALYAVTFWREIGIDVEFVREDFASLTIAKRFFSTDEVAMLHALPPKMRTSAFFSCWTRKEAYIKARGEGLSRPLDCFTVSLVPGEPAALLRTGDDPEEGPRWSLIEVYPKQGYRAALAVEGNADLHCWQWTGMRDRL